ncbi:hypothetical protein ALC53_08765, partial [Atta colombica]
KTLRITGITVPSDNCFLYRMREKGIRKEKKEKEEIEERKTERKRATRRKRNPNRPTIDSLPCKIAHSDKENKKK